LNGIDRVVVSLLEAIVKKANITTDTMAFKMFCVLTKITIAISKNRDFKQIWTCCGTSNTLAQNKITY